MERVAGAEQTEVWGGGNDTKDAGKAVWKPTVS